MKTTRQLEPLAWRAGDWVVVRDIKRISELPRILLILPYKISCDKGSSESPLISLVVVVCWAIHHRLLKIFDILIISRLLWKSISILTAITFQPHYLFHHCKLSLCRFGSLKENSYSMFNIIFRFPPLPLLQRICKSNAFGNLPNTLIIVSWQRQLRCKLFWVSATLNLFKWL